MRYTTILDLRDWPPLYANSNIRLLYLHLVLISGYHDYNRDLATTSLRRLEAETGLTLSAVRHGLACLEKYKIIQRKGGKILVRKWLEDQAISPRPKNKKPQVVTELQTEPKSDKTSRQQLEERAAQGDVRAKEILTKHFRT